MLKLGTLCVCAEVCDSSRPMYRRKTVDYKLSRFHGFRNHFHRSETEGNLELEAEVLFS